ncbi:type IVB secretion system protein IcmH/DotU [Pararhodobacter sp. SW119]|uniref:type IVB secretion system protein IcmH/DotU n=1 Tax=Pararhodobacter sp. SW119 TaxID=2780075 RepID=UPI001AE0A120|nr:type IVB secretion system protein IcmH/DotU [Pararhodobacter sp. SW119]
MSDNDPFAEPDDTDKTVIRPNPGARRPVSPAQPPAPAEPPAARSETPEPAVPPQAARGSGPGPVIAPTGMNQLVALATPLFSLISRIRNRAQHLDPEKLRQSVVAEVRRFEEAALKARVDPKNIKVARYALCATLDDVVLNTPWGDQSSWGLHSMVATFHRETVGGDRFYDLLSRLEQDPANNLELLEFMYMCLSLGFEGRLRIDRAGAARHQEIRTNLATIIRNQRGTAEHDLSPHWQGVNRPHRPLSAWKTVWIATAALAVILALSYTALSWALGTGTQRLIGQLGTVDSGSVPQMSRPAPPPPPPPPTRREVAQLETVSGFLSEEIAEGLIEVLEDGNAMTIRIAGASMFASASDVLQDRYRVPLERVANALNEVEGRVIIAGHSDSIPINTARYPSNTHLSLARATTVKDVLAPLLDNPDRLSAEGRAEREPIADNATAEGRAANRRIEVILIREES